MLAACNHTPQEPAGNAATNEANDRRNTQVAYDATIAAIDPESLRMTEEVLGAQRAEIDTRMKETEDRREIIVTQQEQASQAVQATADVEMINTAQAEVLRENLIWKADFETGNLSQFQGKGDFLRQGSGMYNMVTTAHSGNFSVALTIDTTAPTETGAHSAYLFFWNQLPEDAYYYSAWYYFPNDVKIWQWWTIMQWKSTYDGDSSHSIRVFEVGVENVADGMKLSVNQRPLPNENNDNNVNYHQNLAIIPIQKWFQVEVYYKRGMNHDGQIIVWQDGLELFNIRDVTTVFSDNTIYYSVHNYSNGLQPSPTSIFVDDIAISKVQIGNRQLP